MSESPQMLWFRSLRVGPSILFLKKLSEGNFDTASQVLRNDFLSVLSESKHRASPVVQWLRIHLPMQGTQVRALVQEDPTCRGTTKPEHHNYWACTLEPVSHNYWSPCATTTEASRPRAHAPQQEKPSQWEARAPQQRVAPAGHN